ncbi:MAG: fibronectin type III domain-containing protein, partial [Acidobacteriota bacterium]
EVGEVGEFPLTDPPLATTRYELADVRFGERRCFAVRAVDTVAGVTIEGPLSEPGCVTPVDTFPPAAPGSLAAVATSGAISLIWDGGSEADLAGYIVLRGAGAGASLETLTPTPIRETTYRDERVTPGTRYVYAVVAVDTAGNASGQSNRVEETARP